MRLLQLLEQSNDYDVNPEAKKVLGQKAINQIRKWRDECRADEGGGGMCHMVSEIIDMKYGWERYSGTYCDPKGEIICVSHFWNILPDGSILDSTADQFGEGWDIKVVKPNDPEYNRYRPEWFADYHPGHPDIPKDDPVHGYDWSGEFDDEWTDKNPRPAGWYLDDEGKKRRIEYFRRQLEYAKKLNASWAQQDIEFYKKMIDQLQNESLTERRQQQTKLMYHGTSDVFLRSILKNGLMANPPKRTYGGDADDPGPSGYETMGGVYITDNLNTAKTAAWDAAKKFGGQPMIVTVQYTIGSGALDEDHITAIIGNIIRSSMEETDEDEEEFDTFYEYYLKFKDYILDKWTDQGLNKLNKFGDLNRQFENNLRAMFDHYMNYVEEDEIYSHTEMVTLQHDPKFLKLLNSLTRGVNDDPMRMKNIQIDRNIGYRGKTKIIKIETSDGVVYDHPSPYITA